MTTGRYSTPFANGTEVDWFRSARCDQCVNDHPDGGGCDEFALGVVVDGGWATDGRLVPVDRSRFNPLGVECTEFRCADHDPAPPPGTACATCGIYTADQFAQALDAQAPNPDQPTEEVTRG